jgi:xanthosine utilization system XapX-like protein
VVVRAFPLKLTVEPLTKFVPFTVNVNPAPPAIALVGEMLVIVGASGAWT